MSENVCKECGKKFDGHGRRLYCDDCMTTTCAGCGAEMRVSQFTHKAERNYCGHECQKNHELRDFIAENVGKMSAKLMADKRGVSRQRIYQLLKEIRETG